jgi:hypothetical protein
MKAAKRKASRRGKKRVAKKGVGNRTAADN